MSTNTELNEMIGKLDGYLKGDHNYEGITMLVPILRMIAGELEKMEKKGLEGKT